MNSTELDVCPRFVKDISKQLNIYIYLLVLSVFFNAVLAMTATLGNGLVIFTILKSQNLQTPSYLLITSLAFTDLFFGLIYNPFFVQFSASFLLEKLPIVCFSSRFSFYFGIFLGAVSIIMNLFISIDRYLALTLRHRYRIHVTKKRVRIAIVAGWVLSCCFCFLMSLVYNNALAFMLLTFIPALTFMVLTCFFYIKLFVSLHRYSSQVQSQQPNSSPGNFDVIKYRKTLKTMVAILGCFLVCWVMDLIALITMNLQELTPLSIHASFAGFIVFGANSSINPVIYLTRFKDIRQESKHLLNKLTFR